MARFEPLHVNINDLHLKFGFGDFRVINSFIKNDEHGMGLKSEKVVKHQLYFVNDYIIVVNAYDEIASPMWALLNAKKAK